MKTRKGKREPSRARQIIGRKLLQNLLTDLEGRTKRQALIAESIEALVAQVQETTPGEFLIFPAIGQTLERHAQGMRDLLGFVEIIAEDRTVRS